MLKKPLHVEKTKAIGTLNIFSSLDRSPDLIHSIQE